MQGTPHRPRWAACVYTLQWSHDREPPQLAMGARRVERLEALKARLVETGSRAEGDFVCVATDVTDRAAVKGLVAAAEESLGPVDILVNNGATEARACTAVSLSPLTAMRCQPD